jgi:hypothetical protein
VRNAVKTHAKTLFELQINCSIPDEIGKQQRQEHGLKRLFTLRHSAKADIAAAALERLPLFVTKWPVKSLGADSMH